MAAIARRNEGATERDPKDRFGDVLLVEQVRGKCNPIVAIAFLARAALEVPAEIDPDTAHHRFPARFIGRTDEILEIGLEA